MRLIESLEILMGSGFKLGYVLLGGIHESAAEEAVNVFYHYTYEGNVDIDSITDPRMKASILAQINHFGQTPKQLFLKPRVKRWCDKKLLLIHFETVLKSHKYPVTALRLTSDLKQLLSGDSGGHLLSWTLQDENSELHLIRGHIDIDETQLIILACLIQAIFDTLPINPDMKISHCRVRNCIHPRFQGKSKKPGLASRTKGAG
uniref:BEACH domain-containing protein n=1 Tax=Nelumbo nucifera TaxID=4432 RepID=A0A822YY37_NELNU|nr:TPA_asm: hypothetical protein HUJ06_013317 [Nelumbo nucifera]